MTSNKRGTAKWRQYMNDADADEIASANERKNAAMAEYALTFRRVKDRCVKRMKWRAKK